MDAQTFAVLKSLIGGIVRWLLNLIFGGLILKGYVQDDHLTMLSTLIAGALVTLGWSLFKHYRAQFRIKLALHQPAGTERATLERKFKER